MSYLNDVPIPPGMRTPGTGNIKTPTTTPTVTPLISPDVSSMGNAAKETINYYLPAQQANQIAQQNTSAMMEFNAAQAEKQMQFQKQSAKEAMEFNRIEAQKNRDWQKMMSDSAYQRAILDMKKAGLNPILAYQQGGSSTPSGATASGYAMNGSSASASAAQTFKGDWSEAITMLAMSAVTALANTMQAQQFTNKATDYFNNSRNNWNNYINDWKNVNPDNLSGWRKWAAESYQKAFK